LVIVSQVSGIANIRALAEALLRFQPQDRTEANRETVKRGLVVEQWEWSSFRSYPYQYQETGLVRVKITGVAIVNG
jgi:hypothetical protein